MPNVPEGSSLPVHFHFVAGSLWVGTFDIYVTVLAPKKNIAVSNSSLVLLSRSYTRFSYDSHVDSLLPNTWPQHLSEAVEEDSVNCFLLYSLCNLHGRHWHVWSPTRNGPWTLFKDTTEHTCNSFCSLLLSTLGKFLRDFAFTSWKLNWVVCFSAVTLPTFPLMVLFLLNFIFFQHKPWQHVTVSDALLLSTYTLCIYFCLIFFFNFIREINSNHISE